jgi:transcriptional regulator with XRE-family HTH domain
MARFGYSIRILRQARSLTGAQLAAKAKISPAYLSLIEGDERVPPDATLERLADALDVDATLLRILLPDASEPKASMKIRDLGSSLKRLARAEADLKRKLG